MRTRILLLSSILALAATISSAHAGKAESIGLQANRSGRVALAPLTDTEKADLLFMREEEELARDVYSNFAEIWSDMVFENIAKAETKHFNAIGKLLAAYGLQDSASQEEGQFNNSELQALYDDLLVRGSTSHVDALMIGGLIEEVDIEDLANAKAAAAKPAIQRVYDNLLCGSRNHLRAFARNLEFQGIAYEAQHLSQEEVDEILDTPMDRCGK